MIVTHFDKNYMQWGEMFLRSVALTMPCERVYVSGVNLSGDDRDRLQLLNANLIIHNSDIDFDGVMERRDGGGYEARWKILMQCRVSQVAIEAAVEFPNEILIVMNADMLVRKSLEPLYELAQEYHVILPMDQQHIDRKELQNGVMIFNTTNHLVLELLDFYNQMNFRELKWYDDQKWMWTTYNRFVGKLPFGELPGEFVDGDMLDDSPIWSAHKDDREANRKKFVDEIARMETMG